jgi:hypothetical protein
MGEVVGLLVVGAVLGGLVAFSFSWDHGFKAGVSWATRTRYGLSTRDEADAA